ncbi:MAG: hypothetical protein SGPRY_008113 [Prymnesium sp.]
MYKETRIRPAASAPGEAAGSASSARDTLVCCVHNKPAITTELEEEEPIHHKAKAKRINWSVGEAKERLDKACSDWLNKSGDHFVEKRAPLGSHAGKPALVTADEEQLVRG